MPVRFFVPLPGPAVWVSRRRHAGHDDGGLLVWLLAVPLLALALAAFAVYGLFVAARELALWARSWWVVLRRERARRHHLGPPH